MKGPFLLFLLLVLANLADAQSSDSGRITFLDLDASVSPDLLDRLDHYQPMTDRERVLLKNNLDSLTAWISVDLAIALPSTAGPVQIHPMNGLAFEQAQERLPRRLKLPPKPLRLPATARSRSPLFCPALLLTWRGARRCTIH